MHYTCMSIDVKCTEQNNKITEYTHFIDTNSDTSTLYMKYA